MLQQLPATAGYPLDVPGVGRVHPGDPAFEAEHRVPGCVQVDADEPGEPQDAPVNPEQGPAAPEPAQDITGPHEPPGAPETGPEPETTPEPEPVTSTPAPARASKPRTAKGRRP